jgi:hypothetical protein
MTIYADGCSFTYGAHLRPSKDAGGPGEISDLSWPCRLGAFNRGICAASNKQILYRFLTDVDELNISSDDTVIFMWTWDHRYGFLLDKENHWEQVYPENPNNVEYSTNPNDYQYEFYRSVNHAYFYCEYLGVRQLHTVTCSSIIKDKPPLWNQVEWIPGMEMQTISNKYPPALDGAHPGPLAHKEFAERCASQMKI